MTEQIVFVEEVYGEIQILKLAVVAVALEIKPRLSGTFKFNLYINFSTNRVDLLISSQNMLK